MAPPTATITEYPGPAPKKRAVANGAALAGQDPADEDEAARHQRDFYWTYTEEPHWTRRLAIIKAHPEVTKLCGHEPLTKYVVAGVVGLQVLLAYLLRDRPFFSWQLWAVAYVFGATASQNLFLAIHEISHNLAFRSPLANRLFAVFANLPIGLPYSASFRPYHLTHHKSLGVDGVDTDLPTAVEALLFDSILGKAFFCTFQILFYALRPVAVYRVPFTWVHWLNVAVQLAFDYLVVFALSGGGGTHANWRPLQYLLLSSFLAGSLHPTAGHFISEHYVYERVSAAARGPRSAIPVPETFSYYGPLNLFTYNVGLHNEHHDFPAVPWTRLHALNRMAAEFYDDLPQHRSWVGVLWRFVLDPDLGMKCRVKRRQGGRLVGGRTAKAGSGAAAAVSASAKVEAGWQEDEIEA